MHLFKILYKLLNSYNLLLKTLLSNFTLIPLIKYLSLYIINSLFLIIKLKILKAN